MSIADFLKNKFEDKKLESLGIVSYAGGKFILWSRPSVSDVIVAVFLVVFLRLCKKASKLGFIEVLKEWGGNIDRAWIRFCERLCFPVFESHQLIEWLTNGKFDANIACEEKTPFFKPDKKCRHKKCCHFTHERDRMPKAIQMGRFAAMFVGNIYVSEFLNVMKVRQLSPRGYFIAYDVFGITFKIAEDHWKNILKRQASKKKYYSHTVVQVIAHIARFGGRIRIHVEARQVRNEAGMAIIRGNYINGFTPRKIRPHRKGCLSVPLCAMWKRQFDPSSQLTYTPVRPIP